MNCRRLIRSGEAGSVLAFFCLPPPTRIGAKSASITCGGAPILSSPISPPLSARARSPSESASASSRRLRSNRSLPCVHCAVVIGTFALPRLTERQYRLEVRIVLSC